jgi:hypothetical protein
MKVTTHFHQMPRLRICEATPLFRHTSWRDTKSSIGNIFFFQLFVSQSVSHADQAVLQTSYGGGFYRFHVAMCTWRLPKRRDGWRWWPRMTRAAAAVTFLWRVSGVWWDASQQLVSRQVKSRQHEGWSSGPFGPRFMVTCCRTATGHLTSQSCILTGP